VARVLAVDIGTSSIRATVYGGDLRPVKAGVQVHYRWRVSADGGVEAPATVLERAVAHAIDRALARTRGRIDAVSTASFWHSLMGVDGAGRPVTPLLPWSDTRSAREAAALRERVDERIVHQRTGCRFHPSYWPSRLWWFAAHDVKTFRRVRRWLSFPAYLHGRWLGRTVESRSQASGTGLFVHERSTWDEDLASICGVTPEQFAPIVDLDYDEAEPAAHIARRWPALRRTRWIPPAGDGALNNLGAGCADAEHAALMIGTSGAVRVMWDTDTVPEIPPGLWRYWLDRRRVVVGGALSNGGNLVMWMHKTLGLELGRPLEAAIARLPPDGHGLTMLPFLAGERSPDYLPDARGSITGLRLATTREEILRAGLEAVALRFGAVVDALSHRVNVKRIVATGTALTASHVWPQILADVLGRPLALPRDAELTSRGAAIIGFEGIGVRPKNPKPAIARIFRPDRRSHEIYQAAAARQQRLLAAVT
jgi:gluconokinase